MNIYIYLQRLSSGWGKWRQKLILSQGGNSCWNAFFTLFTFSSLGRVPEGSRTDSGGFPDQISVETYYMLIRNLIEKGAGLTRPDLY